MKRFWTLLMIAAASLTSSGMATAKELTDEEVRALQATIKSADHLTADFSQSTYKHLREKTVVRTGKAMFARPDKFKWILERPDEQKIYDGRFFYDYQPASKAAARLSATGPQAHELKGIVDLVLNFDTLLKRYDLVKAEENGDEVRIELKPRSVGDVQRIELKLSKKAAFITSLRMDFQEDHQTHVFSNPSRAKIPDTAFKLPAGVKVTDSN